MRAGRNAACKGQEGYILLALLATSAILLAGLALSIPRMALQSQRVQDEQLIERGEQYRRAIELYYREHNKYPQELDDLEDTNGVRYLRRRYADPMGETGEWRLIHMGTDGRFEDSLLFDTAKDRRTSGLGQALASPMGQGLNGPIGSQPGPGTANFPGTPLTEPEVQDPFAPPTPEERFQAVRESAAPDLAGATRYSQGFEFDSDEADSAPPPGGPPDYSRMLPSQVPMDENERRFAAQDTAIGMGGIDQDPRLDIPSSPGAPQDGFRAGSGARTGPPGAMVSESGAPEMINRLLTSPRPGGIAGVTAPAQAVAAVPRFERGIAGVASTSEATGVKVYNGKEAYNEWEFVYDYRQGSGEEGAVGGAQLGIPNQIPNQMPPGQLGPNRRNRPIR